jgi:anti-sigma factor RsiW
VNDKSVIADADVIQRYLLGHLPEDQQVKVEERLFTDDAFFGQIELAEDALIDAYISGKLSNEEIVQFEDQFLTTAARRKALEASKPIRESYINKPPPGLLCLPALRRGCGLRLR